MTSSQFDDMVQVLSKKIVLSIWEKASNQSVSIKYFFSARSSSKGETVLTFHDKLPVIPKLMTKGRQMLEPLLRPLFRTITPTPSPLGLAPRITDDNKALSIAFNNPKDGV